jgi:GT2 family glycosyltransferase
MDLSISILTRNQPDLLPRCVASCIAEIQRAGVSSEIIIVDNASTDAYPQRLAHVSPMIRIIRNEENLGFGIANNKAILVSRGRYVLILNDDAILSEDSLSLMLEALDSSPRVAAVGPKFVNPDGSVQSHFTNARFPHLRDIVCQILMLEPLLERNEWTRNALTVCRDPEQSAEAEHVAGACLLVRREALDAIGLFDEGFYYFFEDLDLCRRLIKAGWAVVYLAAARVVHYGSASFRQLSSSDKGATYFKSLLYYFKKHSSVPKYILVRLTLGLTLKTRASLKLLRTRLSADRVRGGA